MHESENIQPNNYEPAHPSQISAWNEAAKNAKKNAAFEGESVNNALGDDAPTHPSQMAVLFGDKKAYNKCERVENVPANDAPSHPSHISALFGDEKAVTRHKIDFTNENASLSSASSSLSSTRVQGSGTAAPTFVDPRIDQTLTEPTPTTGARYPAESTLPTPSNDSPISELNLSTFYTVEATLVPDATAVQVTDQLCQEPLAPVYDAMLVPTQSSKPWWMRRHGIFLIGTILVMCTVVVILVVMIPQNKAPSEKDNEGTGAPRIKLHPNHSDSCAFLKETLFDTECDNCQPDIAIDGETIVFGKSHEYIKFSSIAEDGLKTVSTINITWGMLGVAVSGNISAMGGVNQSSGEYALHVFERDSGGVWNEAAELVPHGIGEKSWLGRSVGIDGDRLVAGAVSDGDFGSVFVYRRVGGSWEMDTKLSPDIEHLRNFGRAVSIKGDVILVGDRVYGDPRRGAVFVYAFDKSSSLWQLKASITNEDCDQWFGTSLEILDTGLMIGCPREDGGIGAVYFYEGNHTTYQYVLSQKIQSSNGTYYDNFAHNSQLSIDRKHIMAVGTNRKWNGKVYLFTLLNGEWVEFAKISEPNAVEFFGDVVDLSGSNIVVASADNAYLYSVKECLNRLHE